jgi:hypothetical protein
MVSRDAEVDREAKARAAHEVLKSRTLSRSDQLAQFLRYICDLELDGRGAEITEYSIATNALNRPADYSPGEDSSVRSRAHALRRKLQEYYEVEAPDTELRIELPKGSYRPIFVARQTMLQVVPESIPRLAAPLPQSREHVLWRWIAGLASATVVLAAALLVRLIPADPIDPLVRAAWGPVMQRGGDVLVLISSPPMLRIMSSQPGKLPVGGVFEPAPGWAAQWYTGLNLDNRGGPVYLATTRGYAVFSDLSAAAAVSSLLSLSGTAYTTMPEWAVQPRAIHENGLVVIGAPSYTQYLARILKATPYAIWFDSAVNMEVLGPRAGVNGHTYLPKRNPQTNRYSTVYGLITVLPSQPGHSRPERMLVFAGFTGSPGAQGAIDFFRSPAALRDLERRFRHDGYNGFPPAYQVVVRCGVDTETALNAVYETHIVLDSVPVIE